jgi:uncharacterized repeat protein (TIGR01451 family)
MSSWQTLTRKLLQQNPRFLNFPRRSQRIWRIFATFLFVLLLAITQNYWLFLTPAVAQSSTLLRVTNQFLTSPLAPGYTSILRVQINNDSASPLTNLSFVNSLVSSPGAMIIPAAPSILNTCNGSIISTPGSYPGTSGSVTLAGGSVGAGTFCRIEIPVQAFIPGNYIQTINPGNVTSDTLSNGEASSATLQISSANPANLAKSFTPNTIPGDGRARVTLTINNPNTYAITGSSPAALTDTLPTNMFVDTRPGALTPTTTCAGGTVNTLAGNGGVTLVGGSIPAGGSCNITFDATSPIGSNYTNTVASGALNTINRITNSNTVTAALNVQTQISIAKAFGASTLVEEKSTSVTISITNGGGPLTNATLTDNLPAPLVVANTTASTTCSSSGVSRPLAVTVGANSFALNNSNVGGGDTAQVPGSNPSTNALGTCTVTVNVKPATGSIGNFGGGDLALVNTLPINALGNSEGRSNAAPATANITVLPGFAATKSYSPAAIAPGSTTRVTINVNNRSGIVATGVGYTDNLPTGMVVADPPAAALSADCGGGILSPALTPAATSATLTGATIGIDKICSVSFDVASSSPVGTNLDNNIPNNTIGNNQGLDSNGVTGASGRLPVVSRIVVSKSFNPVSVGRGLPSLLTITVDNNRRSTLGIPEPLTNVAITDNLPANLQVANPANFSSNCNGSVTGTNPGSTSLSLSGGSIPPTSSCKISLNVIEINQNQSDFPTPFSYDNKTSGFSNAENEPATMPTAQLTVVSPISNSSKEFQSPSIMANGISTAVITLNNTLPLALTNTAFSDTWIQGNTTVANPPNASTTCPGGIVATSAGSRSVSLSGGTIPARVGSVNGLCTVKFDVIMTNASPSNFINTIPAGAITNDQGFTNPTDISATLDRVVTAVTLTKAINPVNIDFGQPSTLTVTFTNPTSGITLTKLGFVDNMAIPIPGMVVYSAPTPSTTCLNGIVTATPGASTFALAGASLSAGSSCTVSLRVTLTTTGNRTNNLPIGVISTREGVTNTVAASASLSASPALTVAKAFFPPGIVVNGRSSLVITVTNRVPSPLTGVGVTDPLPTDMVVAPVPNASTTCPAGTVTATPGSSSVVLTGANLASSASCKITVSVTSAITGTFSNIIPVGNITASGGVTNHLSATANLVVSGSPQVFFIKRITRVGNTTLTNVVDDPSSTDDNHPSWAANYLKGEIKYNALPNDVVEYTIYFLNAGLSNVKNLRICDRLQPNQEYVPNAYNGLTPTDGGSTSNLGMALALGSANPRAYLSSANDPPDRGQFLAPATAIPSNCAVGSQPNSNGVVVVDITRASDLPTVPFATGAGTPTTSYGYVRFRTIVK